ncbi:hypothetical protein F5148DRAFT_1189042 [Russula earlei]|uniref:Uncharacterized protein n=1 Tax=Russula earlei TaxID=71964 RepID=A0ACC0UC27_9AGAM|nr:hypothetical protein F5148DRAFT_1189042 [Russula earlei]
MKIQIPSSISLSLSLFPLLADAYTWQFTSQPRQCQNLSLAVQGSGQPPYTLLIIPYGPTPLPNNTEVRTIQSITFPENGTTLSFKLAYPENSSFVAVVSDGSGFGSGGTSTSVSVLTSSDSSCYDATQTVQIPWVFNIDPTGGLTQCESVRLWWEPSFVNGTVRFYGAIPGGTSFSIPQGTPSSNNNTGTGFSWTVDITGGTNILLVGGDDRGVGSGGSAPFTVSYSSNSSCLSNNSPSSTPGSPAGGSYPTSTSDTGSGGRNRSSSNTGAIVGGVVGAIVFLTAIFLIAYFMFRRRPYAAVSKERPVNVLQDDDEDGDGSNHDLPNYTAPEPFLVPDPTVRGSSDLASSQDRPLSMATTENARPQSPMTSMTTTTRKSAAPPSLRAVNIIQHDDAGPSEEPTSPSEPETIELPPAYTNIRQAHRSPLATSTTAQTGGDS